jgi:hypothetical protein
MAQVKRESADKPSDISGGPYLAKIISHLDPTFMGGLEVTLLRPDGNTIGEGGQTYPVRYASPFAGQTAFEFQGYNVNDFNDTQKSYGFWFVPPDVGNTVLVFFVEGDPSQGYWLACVPDKFSNHMVPGIAASRAVAFAEGQEEKYDTGLVPVAEANRRANALEENTEIDKIKRAVHPIADHFLEEGLLEDDVRGITHSTSRRNVPSSVYGISTPGPLDRRSGAKKTFIGKTDSQSPVPVPVSRLGGSQFIMDDGDDRYQRRTTAGEGGYDYADTLDGDAGEPTIPSDEYIRLRTRTGHQLLLHTSEDLIYIGNSRGTSWIEMTSDGKIDIFAEDSISIHTKQDLNIRADRDINMEAGRNINMRSIERFHTESGGDTEIIIGANGNITTTINMNIGSGLANYISAGGNTNILSGGSHFETASTIHMNGIPATPATPAFSLGLHDNIVVDNAAVEWKGTRYQSEEPLQSIMKRVPMHEPWSGHENLDPLSVKPDITDREA